MRKIAVEESINGNGTGKKTAEEESLKVIEEQMAEKASECGR